MNNPFLHASLGERLATVFYTQWLYVKLLIFPHPLTYDYYPHQIEIINWSDPRAIIPLIAFIAFSIYAILGLKRKDIVSYGLWLYIIPLSIVSNFFFSVGTFMNERFVFISSIGYCLILGWVIYNYIPKLIKDNKNSRYAIVIIVCIVFCLYSGKTISRNNAWKNDLVLFTTDVKTSTNSAKSHCSAGGKLLEEANKPINKNNPIKYNELCTQAITYLERAVKIYPKYVDAYNLLGNAYYQHKKNIAKSISYYAKGLKANPMHGIIRNNTNIILSNTFGLLNSNSTISTPDEVLNACKELVDTQIKFGEAYHVMGVIYGRYKNNIDSALYYLDKASKVNYTKRADFYGDFGTAYGLQNKYQEALTYFLKAVELDPNNANYLYNTGVTYIQLGDITNGNLYISRSNALKQNTK